MAGRPARFTPRSLAPTFRRRFLIAIPRRGVRTVPAVLPELLPKLRDFGLERRDPCLKRLVLIPQRLKERIESLETRLLRDGRKLLPREWT